MNPFNLIPEVDIKSLLMRIPRPERSGVLSIVLHYALVFMLLTAGAVVDPNIRCWINPNPCKPKGEKEPEAAHWDYIFLYPGGHGKKPCGCHIQYKALEKDVEGVIKIGEVFEFNHSRDTTVLSCYNDFTQPSSYYEEYHKDWQPEHLFVVDSEGSGYEMPSDHPRYLVRLHCDNDPKDVEPVVITPVVITVALRDP